MDFSENFFYRFRIPAGFIRVGGVRLEEVVLSGFHPKPHFIFCLDTKNEAKKVKTSSAGPGDVWEAPECAMGIRMRKTTRTGSAWLRQSGRGVYASICV